MSTGELLVIALFIYIYIRVIIKRNREREREKQETSACKRIFEEACLHIKFILNIIGYKFKVGYYC